MGKLDITVNGWWPEFVLKKIKPYIIKVRIEQDGKWAEWAAKAKQERSNNEGT